MGLPYAVYSYMWNKMIRMEVIVFLTWLIGRFHIIIVYLFKVFLTGTSPFDKPGIYVEVTGRKVITVVMIL